jgi:hypothetical protein
LAGLSLTDLVSIIGNVAIALSFVIALVFGIAQVQAAARDRRERLTLEALRSFSTREFAAFMQHITTGSLPATHEEFKALTATEQVPFIQFAQQMESLGILVSDGLVSLDLVEKTLGSFVTNAWSKYRSVFLDMRVKTDDPFLGEYFQWLAELIAKRLKDNPRPPRYQGP